MSYPTQSPPRRTVEPACEPITLDEAKLQCRVYHDDEDTWFNSAITTARMWVEGEINRTLITTTWETVLDWFPCDEIKLRKPPLLTISSIVYVDANGDSRTLSASSYLVETKGIVGRVTPAYGYFWPDTRGQIGAVTVTYTAGYGASPASVPQSIRTAIALRVEQQYRRDEKYAVAAIDSLLAEFRIVEYG